MDFKDVSLVWNDTLVLSFFLPLSQQVVCRCGAFAMDGQNVRGGRAKSWREERNLGPTNQLANSGVDYRPRGLQRGGYKGLLVGARLES